MKRYFLILLTLLLFLGLFACSASEEATVTEEAAEMSTLPPYPENLEYKSVQFGEVSFEMPEGWQKDDFEFEEENRSIASFYESVGDENPRLYLMLVSGIGDSDFFEWQLSMSDDIVFSDDKHKFIRTPFEQVAEDDTEQRSSAETYDNEKSYIFSIYLDENETNTKYYDKIFEEIIKSVQIQSDAEKSLTDPTTKTTKKQDKSETEKTEPTPIEPSDPIVYSGSGDDVIEIETLPEAWVFYVKGNAEDRFFSVKGYDENGNSTELFVATTDIYEGTTIDPQQETVMLEVSASGAWTIEVRSIYDQDMIRQGETYSGTGDDIILVYSSGTTASIQGNSAARFFAVKSYGDRNNLLVATTDAYDGKVMLKGDPYLLEVSAQGSWSITLD